jgi:hypothetical protein
MPSAATIARFLTPEEVSTEVFGGAVAPGQILNLSKNQGLPSHRVGRRRMFVADEVAAWVRSRDGEGSTNSAAGPSAVSDADAPAVDPEWVAAQVAKFSADDLRRAGELLLALSRADQGGAA